MCLRILEENSDISFSLACSKRWWQVGHAGETLGAKVLCWDLMAILAALSGPNPKAPGFAGGYLLKISRGLISFCQLRIKPNFAIMP